MKSQYSRDELRRLVSITERQLKSWEQLDLVEPREVYSFPEVVKFRALAQLRKQHVAAPKIKQALTAISRKLQHVKDPLTELRLYVEGKRIRVEVDGGSMEVSGQLLLNFDRQDLSRLLEFKPKKSEPEIGRAHV